MADISIDEAKAKQWMDDVNYEIEQVEGILKKVNSSLTSVAGSDDAIMEGIYKVGTAMETAWTTMCNNFKVAQGKVRDAVNKLVSTAMDVVGDTETLRGKMGGR